MSRPSSDLGVLFRDHWRRHFALPAGSRVVVAVSGGIDSMSLLALLARDRLAGEDLEVVAAHFDHRTRGPESAEDGRLVSSAADRWGATAVLGRGDVPRAAARSGSGPQAAARALRHAFLGRVARRTEAAAILTAHQRDDLVETVLLRIVRGASPDGLGALAPIDVAGERLLLRPLLPFSRADITAWAGSTGVPFREDPSNANPRYPRTRLRNEALPLLAQLNPRVDRAVVRLSALAAADAAYLGAEARRLLEEATVARSGSAWRLEARRLVDAPIPLLSRAILVGWSWAATAGSRPPGAEWVQGAVDFVRGGRGGSVPLPGGGSLRRSGGILELRRFRKGAPRGGRPKRKGVRRRETSRA